MAFQIQKQHNSSPKRSSSFDIQDDNAVPSTSFFTFTDGPFQPPQPSSSLVEKTQPFINPKLLKLIDLVGSHCASSIEEIEWLKQHAIYHENEVTSFLIFYFKTFMQTHQQFTVSLADYEQKHPECCVFYYSGWSGQGVVCIPWHSILPTYLSLAKDIHLQTIEFALHHPFST